MTQVKDLTFPFTAVGQLRNGCTAFLVGPCHLITVAHCVYDPGKDIWWPGLEFFPGRNAPEWEPLGRTSWTQTKVSNSSMHCMETKILISAVKFSVSSLYNDPPQVPSGWQQYGDHHYDYAVVWTGDSVGERLGWMDIGDCNENMKLLANFTSAPGSSPSPPATHGSAAIINIAGEQASNQLWDAFECYED